MEWIVILVACCAGILICRQSRRIFENKAAQIEKKYQRTVITRCAYGETLLDTINQMADLLSEESKREIREKAAVRRAIAYDCTKSDSTMGEMMACDDVAELFTKKLSVYGEA